MRFILLALAIALMVVPASATVERIQICEATSGSATGLCGDNTTTLKGKTVCLNWIAKATTCTVSGTHSGLNLDLDGSIGPGDVYHALWEDITVNGNYSIWLKPFQCIRADIDARTTGTVIVDCVPAY